jgi:hypothetical protein
MIVIKDSHLTRDERINQDLSVWSTDEIKDQNLSI